MINIAHLATTKYGASQGGNFQASVNLAVDMEMSKIKTCDQCVAYQHCLKKVTNPMNCAKDFLDWCNEEYDETIKGENNE